MFIPSKNQDCVQHESKKRRFNFTWWISFLGILISSILLFLVLRNVNFYELRDSLSNTDLSWLGPIIVVWFTTLWLRIERWRRLFPSECIPRRPVAADAFLFGAFLNNVLPGRLGDVARATLLGINLPSAGTGGALGTIAVEKLLDGLTVLMLLAAGFLLAPLPPQVIRIGVFGAIVFSVGLILMTGISHLKDNRKRESRSGYNSITSLLLKFFSNFAGSLKILRQGRRLSLAFFMSFCIWMLEILVILFSFHLFLIDVPAAAAVVVMALVCIGTMLPAAPGFIGTYQFFVVTALHMYGISDNTSFALGIFLNLFVIIMTTLVALPVIPRAGGLKKTII